MSSPAPDLEWAVRLSEQIKTLSELTESLTFRLLELEERLVGQEDQLTTLRRTAEQRTDEEAQAMEERLQDTEDRLGRIEALLRKEDQRSAPSHPLRALSHPAAKGREGCPVRTMPSDETDCLDPPHGETVFDDDLPYALDSLDQSLAS